MLILLLFNLCIDKMPAIADNLNALFHKEKNEFLSQELTRV